MYNQYQQSSSTQQPDIMPGQTTQFSSTNSSAMTDRDRINDMLTTEKYLTDSINVFVREASHSRLYQDVRQILGETHHEARNLFNFMFKRGWYSLQAESAQKVAQVQQKFSGYQSQFAQTHPQYQQQF